MCIHRSSVITHHGGAANRTRECGEMKKTDGGREVGKNSKILESFEADIRPFIKDPGEIELWSREFFSQLLPRLKSAAQ